VDRFGDNLLRSAVALHLRSVNHTHAKVDSQPQRRDLAGARAFAFAHSPSALAKRWNTRAFGQSGCSHTIESNLETGNAGTIF